MSFRTPRNVPCLNSSNVPGNDATWMERHVHGGVNYLHDLTVTHVDADAHYIRKVFLFLLRLPRQSPSSTTRPRAHHLKRNVGRAAAGRDGLLLHLSKKLEMSFDLTSHQPQLSASARPSQFYQTIFLDEGGSGDLWTKGEIKQESVIGEKWWKQQTHRYSNTAFVVP
jgi:hypothetical protein